MPDALTLWCLAVLVIGGLMYAMMSMSTRSTPSSSTTSIAVGLAGLLAGVLEVASPIVAIAWASATSRRPERCT